MKPLIVLAMHRSGTSLVASWLQACGIQMTLDGDPGAGFGNEKGHFEHADFVPLHKASIYRQVRHSCGWKARHPKPLWFSEAERAEAIKIVEKLNAEGRPWGWKDPRTVLFAHQWKELIPDAKALVIHRDRESVIDSMVRRSRNGTHPEVKITTAEARLVEHAYSEVLHQFTKDFPNDVMEVSIDELLNGKSATVIDRISKLCEITLEPVSIDSVFDKSSFKSGQSNSTKRRNVLVRAARWVTWLERK